MRARTETRSVYTKGCSTQRWNRRYKQAVTASLSGPRTDQVTLWEGSLGITRSSTFPFEKVKL